ncbi:MAG: GGDEF domain-containing protein [Thalassolituus sp.]|uniref:GGDEF domain-containing protein n=1 Tax=Thalassolituus sp. TaxID=2030822 RepID=UPI0039824F4C
MTLDPASLLLTNAITSLALAAVLLLSRIGMGNDARGIGTWVFGDIVLAMGRCAAVATLLGLPFTMGRDFTSVAGCLGVIGLVAHVQALRSVAGHPARPIFVVAQALGSALLLYLLALPLESLSHKMFLFSVMAMGYSAITLWVLRPLLRFWGARLIALMMLISLVMRLGLLLTWNDVDIPPSSSQNLSDGLRAPVLVFQLAMAMLVTGGFVLLMHERLRARIERLVVTDALTGTVNRHGIMPLLQDAWGQALRHGRPVSVVMFDLDHFKRINDLYGHAIGDEVLAGFAACISSQLQDNDTLSRWGGEEFLLLLNDTEIAKAHAIADRLRQLVAGVSLDERIPSVTVSAGVASIESLQGMDDTQATDSLMDMLDAADRRLYLAKRQRNCVVSVDGDLEALSGFSASQ